MTSAPSKIFEGGRVYAGIGLDDANHKSWMDVFRCIWVPLVSTNGAPVTVDANEGLAYVVDVSSFTEEQFLSFMNHLNKEGQSEMIQAYVRQGYLIKSEGVVTVSITAHDQHEKND